MHWIMLMAPPSQGGGGGGSPLGGLVGLLPILLIFFIFYFLVIRPQSKKQRDLQKEIESLKQGDRVLTTGGIYGTVVSDKDSGNTFVIKIAENVKVEIAKNAISGVVKKAKEA
jgi:preprotein translocase subunit YajC